MSNKLERADPKDIEILKILVVVIKFMSQGGGFLKVREDMVKKLGEKNFYFEIIFRFTCVKKIN